MINSTSYITIGTSVETDIIEVEPPQFVSTEAEPSPLQSTFVEEVVIAVPPQTPAQSRTLPSQSHAPSAIYVHDPSFVFASEL